VRIRLGLRSVAALDDLHRRCCIVGLGVPVSGIDGETICCPPYQCHGLAFAQFLDKALRYTVVMVDPAGLHMGVVAVCPEIKRCLPQRLHPPSTRTTQQSAVAAAVVAVTPSSRVDLDTVQHKACVALRTSELFGRFCENRCDGCTEADRLSGNFEVQVGLDMEWTHIVIGHTIGHQLACATGAGPVSDAAQANKRMGIHAVVAVVTGYARCH